MVETPHGIAMVGGRLIQKDKPEMIQVVYKVPGNIKPEFRDTIYTQAHFRRGPCLFYAYMPEELKPIE